MATSRNQAPESGIIRTVHDRSNQFAQINRALLQNSALSWEARGVLSYLLSKPEDWEVRFTDLVKQGPGESDRMRRILRELERAGHMIRKRDHGAGGRWVWVTWVFENPADAAFSPYADFPYMDKPHTEKPDTENRHIYIDKTSTNTEVTNKESTPAPVGISRNSSVTAMRDMDIPAGTPVNRRPDAPPVRPVPKPSDDPAVTALLDELRTVYPFRGGKVARPALAKRALAGLSPAERGQLLTAARHYAASRDGQEGYAKDLHTWIELDEWREYLTPAQPRPMKLAASGPAPRPYTLVTRGA